MIYKDVCQYMQDSFAKFVFSILQDQLLIMYSVQRYVDIIAGISSVYNPFLCTSSISESAVLDKQVIHIFILKK